MFSWWLFAVASDGIIIYSEEEKQSPRDLIIVVVFTECGIIHPGTLHHH